VLEILEGAQTDVRLTRELLLGQSGANSTIAECYSDCDELFVDCMARTGHIRHWDLDSIYIYP
jgi:hypothetical protein